MITYETVNVTLPSGSLIAEANVNIPAGKVVRMAVVVAGDRENKIINHTVLQNNNEIIKPSDLRFSEKTNGGDFQNSLRPVDFEGGKLFTTKLVVVGAALANPITVQFLFMIVKPEYLNV